MGEGEGPLSGIGDSCIYYKYAVVNVGREPSYRPAGKPHPTYPAMSANDGGPTFHPRCVHSLTPFVERLATEEEKKTGLAASEMLNQTPAELQKISRKKQRSAEV